MEYTSVDVNLAVLQPTPPGSRQSTQFYLDWEQGSTYASPHLTEETDALSSGVSTIDYFDSDRVHKRRRLGGEAPSALAPPYTVTQTSYGVPDVSFAPYMTEDSRAVNQMPFAQTDSMRSPTDNENLFQGSWDGTSRLCCGPWWPSWPSLYTPLTQVAEPLDPSEPYHDVEQVSTSIVSQQYSSPDHIEPLEMMCNNYAATGIFQTPQLASNTSQLTPNPMTIRTEAPLVNGPVTANCLQLATHPMTGPAHKLYVAPVQDFNQEVEGMSFLNSAFVQGPTQEPEHVGFATRKRPAGSPLLQEQAIIFDVVSPCSKSKRGPFRDESLRQQTADTRRHGACIECGRQRIRCMPNVDDPLGPCQGCLRNLPTKVPRIPCLRYRITDVKLSKTGQVPGFEWTRRWSHARKDIKHWASEAVKTIYISEGLSNTRMKFRVKEFVPQTGDKLERSWVHQGTRQSVPIPPFALTRLEDAKQAYEQHITATESGALKRVLGLSSPLLRETYEFAANLRRTRGLDEGSKTLLDITFQLWMVVRFSTMSTWIVGDETLGMPRNILDTSPNPGKIPLPPVLGAQLDSILIHEFQETIRRKLLRQLDKAFRKYKHASWLVTYLVSFILLHNAALITAHDAKYAQKHGMKRRFARERSVADYHMGATIILAHFHNCTRNHPFTDQCNEEELKNLCQMTDDQIRFIRDTRLYIKIYGEEWDRVREEGLYEHDFYFVSQLYQEPWSPHTFNVDGNYSGSEGSSERSASVE